MASSVEDPVNVVHIVWMISSIRNVCEEDDSMAVEGLEFLNEISFDDNAF